MLFRAISVVLCGVAIVACNDESQQSNAPPTGQTISLNPSITYQTMIGWEEPVVSTILDYKPILPYVGPLLDQAVNDLGLNKISIGLTSGVENPSDACQLQYMNGTISESTYVSQCAYNSVNDNADPNVVNINGFHFPIFDSQIEQMLLPLKQRVEARGEKLYVQLRYVDFGNAPFRHFQDPNEYAELMQVTFDHMRTKYGVTPDGIDVMNEPDNVAGWTGTAMGQVIAKSGPRLAGLGYHPDFIGPSTVDKAHAVPFFNAMMAVPGASQYIKDLSWHCYGDSGSNTSMAIAGKAVQAGVRTSMTECWSTSNTYQMLHQELKTSRNASWGLGLINGRNGYYDVNAGTGQITLRPKAKFIRQYYKYIRAGAQRIEALTGDASFDPVAFINTDGRYVVVVKASASGSFMIKNLPAGTYGIFYTTGPDGLTVSNYDVHPADQTVASGQGLTTSIPSAGVLTVYAKTGGAGNLRSSLSSNGGAVAASGVARVNATALSVSPRNVIQSPPPQSPIDARSSSAVSTRLAAAAPVDGRMAPPAVVSSGGPARSRFGAVWPKSLAVVTHDGARLRLEQIAGEVAEPTDFAILPDGRLLVAERDGRVRVVRGGRLIAEAALSLREESGAGEQLLALAVDPQFDRTHYVYAIYTTGSTTGARTFCLARFREAADTLADRIMLLDDVAASSTAAAALRFGPDGKLFAAFDDGGVEGLGADLASVNGKVLRLNPDGTTPSDQAAGNPLFSFAYRSPHGFDWHPTAHTLWMADRDSPDSSRLDLVAARAGPDTRGAVHSAFRLPEGTLASSVAFYRGGSSAMLRDNLLVASDEGRQLLRIQLDPNNSTQISASERLVHDVIGGIRVVAVGPDGTIYLGTANALGRLIPQ